MLFNLFKTKYEKLCNNNGNVLKSINKTVSMHNYLCNVKPAESKIRHISIYDKIFIIKIAKCKSDVLFAYSYNGNTTNVRMTKKEIKIFNQTDNVATRDQLLNTKVKSVFMKIENIIKLENQIQNTLISQNREMELNKTKITLQQYEIESNEDKIVKQKQNIALNNKLIKSQTKIGVEAIGKLRVKYKELKQENGKLEQEHKKQISKLENMRIEKVKACTEELDRLRAKYRELKQENKEWNKNIEIHKKVASKLRNDWDKNVEEVEVFVENFMERRQQFESLLEENKKLEKRNKELKHKNDELEVEHHDAEDGSQCTNNN